MPTPEPDPALDAVGDGVWAWVQPGGEPGVANAGVVADDDGLTVIDTLMVRSQWEAFAAAVGELGRPVRRVVLTHAHIDHVGGTSAFRNAAVYASPLTSRLLDQELALDAYRSFMPGFAAEIDDLAEAGTRPVSHLVADAAALTPRIEVLPVAAHTPGDVMVLVADADVCFTGDVCSFGVAPLAFQGDPQAWATVLEAVAELAGTFVPGHGRLGRDRDVRELQAYLRACVAAAGRPDRVGPGPWDAWSGRELADAVNVERAALLRAGRDEIPPSMLRAISADPGSSR